MRLLAMADLHGTDESFHALTRYALEHDPDAVVLAGDLLRIYPGRVSIGEGMRACARRLTEILEPVPAPVFYIMGNDDFVDWRPAVPRFRSIHGRRIEFPPVNLVGYQYSPPFMNGIYERPEKRIEADLLELERLVDETTVLVTHSPAAGILDEAEIGAVGSRAIRELVDRRPPLAHVHGHIHRCYGREGRHFNAAAGGEARALLIDLDTLEAEELRG